MERLVSITRQGQLTIPKDFLAAFDIQGPAKAVVRKEGARLVVEPKKNFWSLAGSLKSGVRLSDRQLRDARTAFGREWPRKDI